MLRRVACILGGAFVAACLAAYPLTWGRYAAVYYNRFYGPIAEGRVPLRAGIGVEHGRLVAFTFRSWNIGSGWDVSSGVSSERGWADHYAVGYHEDSRWGVLRLVYVPLWLPMLLVGTPVGWSWWRRQRRRAVGFPLDSRGEGGVMLDRRD